MKKKINRLVHRVQERQQSLNLMEKLNAEKKSKSDLEVRGALS